MSDIDHAYSEDEETPDPSEDSGSVSSEDSYSPDFDFETFTISVVLRACYHAIFGVSAWRIPPKQLWKWTGFLREHFHREYIKRLQDFDDEFEHVLRLFRSKHFIEQYEALYPDLPATHVTTDAAIANLRRLRYAIRRKGRKWVSNHIQLLITTRQSTAALHAAILEFLAGYTPPPPPRPNDRPLRIFYNAIFREFIPLVSTRPATNEWGNFISFHHTHTPQILTLDAFYNHYDLVIQAYLDHGLDRELVFISSLHQNINYDAMPLNVRSPLENDIMSLVCAYRPRRALANIPGHTQTPDTRHPRFSYDRTHTDENKEKAHTTTQTPTQPPTRPTAQPPAQPRPRAPRARMTVSELLTQLRTL